MMCFSVCLHSFFSCWFPSSLGVLFKRLQLMHRLVVAITLLFQRCFGREPLYLKVFVLTMVLVAQALPRTLVLRWSIRRYQSSKSKLVLCPLCRLCLDCQQTTCVVCCRFSVLSSQMIPKHIAESYWSLNQPICTLETMKNWNICIAAFNRSMISMTLVLMSFATYLSLLLN